PSQYLVLHHAIARKCQVCSDGCLSKIVSELQSVGQRLRIANRAKRHGFAGYADRRKEREDVRMSCSLQVGPSQRQLARVQKHAGLSQVFTIQFQTVLFPWPAASYRFTRFPDSISPSSYTQLSAKCIKSPMPQIVSGLQLVARRR